ncbi:Fe-Mn family superoxide dismutase [Bremerella volcania]|uniref:Fe-Mn family superoxide dismutase n=1 Tax=Bremerella volcania TaxID=2527984 RepID=UPI0037043919
MQSTASSTTSSATNTRWAFSGAIPLIVIDTYEHAYYIDYQNRKAEYVEKFIDHIDWAEANRRFAVHA